MDFEAIKLAVQIGQFLLTGGVGIYVYMSNKDKVTNTRITELERATNASIKTYEQDSDTRIQTLEESIDKRLGDHAVRIARLEERAENAPTHDDLGELHEKINGVNEHLKTMSGEFTSFKGLLITIHDYILKGGKVS